MFYVYVIRSKRDKWMYVGSTNNLKRRFAEHNFGEGISTKHKIPFQLIYYEAYRSEADARIRESNLKRHAGSYTHLKRRA